MLAANLMLRIMASDIDAYEKFFFGRLSKLLGVQEITSTVGAIRLWALSEIKSTHELPIDD